ncbi:MULTISPECIES: hypothetical protein [unclassified Synechocystis]|uniref:hypothetical protein n=1 Tax=unclassified Synechocystis TaxID=2640012 RepID=UPI000406200E|nr:MULTISPECIES: hypothetical protein [unclassified Synechocystis]AIE75356.1 hypothetical protein D082_28280 [Synechocystis sp. PCC 6714]MCT0253591.1 hypothetical protein [Synechocystis sp. CS-94]
MRILAPNPLWQTLLFTAGIALAAGMGFGMALRSAPPTVLVDSEIPTEPQTGGGIFRSEQSFPPQPGWNLDSQGEDENNDGARYNSLQTQP